jgi:GNAT superfamily N-acetyltransferase
MIVRPCLVSDIDALIELVGLHVSETSPHMPFEEDVVSYYAKLSTEPEARFGVWVCERDGVLIGYIVAHAAPYMYCREVSAGMEAIFVRRECRGGRAAMMLIRAYEEWATKTINAKEIFVGVNHGLSTNRAEKFFANMGFEPTGSFYRKVN